MLNLPLPDFTAANFWYFGLVILGIIGVAYFLLLELLSEKAVKKLKERRILPWSFSTTIVVVLVATFFGGFWENSRVEDFDRTQPDHTKKLIEIPEKSIQEIEKEREEKRKERQKKEIQEKEEEIDRYNKERSTWFENLKRKGN